MNVAELLPPSAVRLCLTSDLCVDPPPAQHQRHGPGQVQEGPDGSLRHQRRRKDPEERAGSLPRPQTQLTNPHLHFHASDSSSKLLFLI